MASDVPQDPCREWLGIDAADLGDHRRVLGVAPEERDPLVVLRAADARLVRLRSVQAGSLEPVRVGFVKRVEAARESVLAAIAAAAPASPAAPAFRAPPPPSTLAPPPPTVRQAPAAAPPPVPRPAVPVPAVPPPPLTPMVAVQPAAARRVVYRKQTPVAGIAAALVGLSALAGGLGYYALVVKPQQAARLAQIARERAAADADAEEEPDVQERSPTRPATAEDGDRPPPRARPRRPRSPSSDPEAASSVAMATRDAGAAPPKPDLRVKDPAKPKAATVRETAKDSTKPAPAAGMSEKDAATDAAKDTDKKAAEEVGRLDGTLAEVLAAVRAGEDAAAARLLEAAAAAARGAPARDRLSGWQRLVESHRKFFAGRTAALGALEPGARYEVGGRAVVIEKIDGGQCVYRVSGAARTVALEKLPIGIVLAIVADWFGDDPAGDLAVAAFQLFRPEPEVRLARERLEMAGDAGADVATLLPLCDDPLFAAADGESESR